RNPSTSFLADDNSNTAMAVFGQANMDLRDDLELSLALRYDEEERVQDVSPLQFPAGVPGARNKETFDMLQPKVTLRYKPSEAHNLYATWGRGFRSGQFNQNGISGVAAAVGLNGIRDVVDQEESESFEVGYKGMYLGDRLRVIAAAFATKVEGQQFFSFIGEVSAQILTNIDEVQLYGGELELNLRATENLDLYASAGYTDSEIKEYIVDPSLEGNDAPYIAETTFNIGGQYEAPLDVANLNAFVRVDFERRGSQYWDVQNSSDRDALDFLSVRLGVTDADDKWSLLWQLQNALDEEYNSEWVAGGFSARAPGRIWNLRLRYNF
ncbi:MAG: TonB-dependent receptor, partial [Chromatocurvus sp.]